MQCRSTHIIPRHALARPPYWVLNPVRRTFWPAARRVAVVCLRLNPSRQPKITLAQAASQTSPKSALFRWRPFSQPGIPYACRSAGQQVRPSLALLPFLAHLISRDRLLCHARQHDQAATLWVHRRIRRTRMGASRKKRMPREIEIGLAACAGR
ncbi:hypothetical protein N658DRAFT_100981 [Parathielavia hyrcaniae]|uniref:Uncharacterized protein n=1 Tax=Parathielavia hyrcaniae TaxID=113614 RepID=A0AAN6T118_9PEZI|nr:hypothetical protein N658DRAFT_100981 [Parathielavia hyrcaniae]